MKLPYFPLFASDWLGSTRIALMTPLQEGAYLRLLCHCWGDPNCSIPSDPVKLGVLTKLGAEWVRHSETVLACFEAHPSMPGRIHNPRLTQEWERLTRYYSNRSSSGRMGAASRWGTRERAVEPIHEPEPVPEPARRPVPGPDPARTLAKKLVELWNEGQPTQIRITPHRIAKVKARLADGFTAEQLEQAVRAVRTSPFHNGVNERGWKASGPEWVLHKTERVEEFLNGPGRRAPAPRRTCANCNGIALIPRDLNGGMRPCPSCPEGRAQMERVL